VLVLRYLPFFLCPLEFSRKIYEKLVNYWVKWIKTSQECSFGEHQNVVTKFNMVQRESNLPIG
jgi:hypothetical protein